MLVRIANGHKIAFSHVELLYVLRKPYFHVFLLIGQVVAVVAAAIVLPEGYSRVNFAIFTISTAYIFILLYTLAFTVASVIYSVRNWKILYEPALTFLTIIVATFAASQVKMWLSLYVYLSFWDRTQNILVNFAVVEVFVFLYVYVLQSYIVADANLDSDTKDDFPTGTHVSIGNDLSVAINDILVVKAQAQYVEIHTTPQTYVARVGFRNIISQMPSKSGIQIHRSTWVALKAIKAARRTRDGTIISTEFDDSLKVARGREKDVHKALQDHGIRSQANRELP